MAPPAKIEYSNGQVVLQREVSRASFLIRIRSDAMENYEPGHVLALAIQDPNQPDKELIHPYTITRSDQSRKTFDILYRLIPSGKMTPVLSTLKPGAAVRFGGRFHVPILEGIHPSCKRVVAISTGVGAGPLLGFAEQAAAADGPGVRVFAGFRGLEDVCFEDEFEELGVEFRACVSELWDDRYPVPMGFSGLRGRVTRAVPRVLAPEELPTTHFHLIGNGAMVSTMRRGLELARVPAEHVTIETYFNHKSDPDEAEAQAVAAALLAPAQAEDQWAGSPS